WTNFRGFVCSKIRLLMLLLPLLEAAIELEEFGEGGADDFPVRRLLAADRLNISYVLPQFLQLPSIHITLNRLEPLDTNNGIAGFCDTVCTSAHDLSSYVILDWCRGLRRYRNCFLTVSSAKPNLSAAAWRFGNWSIAV